ncbi:MAG TPA: DUF1499 domain-containing protein [Plasticicumulans sp.]|uniref:DUF1499 domain-containing protein n=1 Tax=Plasticicumulans sp. TaxID=2307179 RepID=UPI002C1C7A92|nr:DUF1499 domain-containing protein [Plasticicumulans sp.]HMV39941.1 DUF1499 domain-containing protein [Plasticicumulans sp.]HMW30259.1 DUF1499 domain-containing protein [Plasticicumulans sp.]HMW43877.1 DUF1499 domain-containing protein [Plasticicumulans sp.]HMZ12011.1 DUF1499 domain-containing protein [Plasticicumulans sp.]HND99053.1 DUF1499 domain-containing protein [Plasticicumulans sp.]
MQILTTLIALAGCLAIGALVLNGVRLGEPPGMGRRLLTYLNNHVAETRRGHDFPELELRCYRMSPAQLYDRVEQALRVLNWEIVEASPQAQSLHATVTSQLLRFVDDVHIELRVAACGTELHVRSQSRIGRGDFGANARHVMELHLTLDRLL